MARKIVSELIEDIDGGPADETVVFTLDGKNFEIDLSTENAAKLRGEIETWAAKARRSASPTSATRRPGRGGRSSRDDPG